VTAPESSVFARRALLVAPPIIGIVVGFVLCAGQLGCMERKTDESNLPCVPGYSDPCYSGPQSTENVGACRRGLIFCWEEAGEYRTICKDEVMPKKETCNGIDDDCDGIIDNTLENDPIGDVGQACVASFNCPTGVDDKGQCLGECAKGKTACKNGELLCAPGQPVAEDCSQVDKDCDGVIHGLWVDADGDGYPAPPTGLHCPYDFSWDCDDEQAAVHPHAFLPCGKYGKDQDCDGKDDVSGVTCECVPACDGKQCGDSGCEATTGVSCGSCDAPQQTCENNQCVCPNPCGARKCGFDGCGFACGTGACSDGYVCAQDGSACCPAAVNCLGKCGGSDGCGGTCPNVCPLPGQYCNSDICACPNACTGKLCGFDGCGLACGVGACPDGTVCLADGSACCPWSANCAGKCGGSDGCGGTCPDICAAGYHCDNNLCVCTPDCGGRSCGPDPNCGTSCGTCPGGTACSGGSCI
jgi:hypothetical protein